MARVAEGDALLLSQHGMVVEIGDAVRGGVRLAQVADGISGYRPPSDDVLADDYLGDLRRDPLVKHPGAAGRLHVQQRFGKAQAQGADFGNICRHAVCLQGSVHGTHDFKAAGGLTREAGANPNPWAVTVGQSPPSTLSLSEDGIEIGNSRGSHDEIQISGTERIAGRRRFLPERIRG